MTVDTLNPATMSLERRYLELLKKTLTRSLDDEPLSYIPPNRRTLAKSIRYAAYSAANALLRPAKLALAQTNRTAGETMMGMGALDNLHACLDRVVEDKIPGDVMETGVWRGGGCIFMRAHLLVNDDQVRRVWVADSFEGLPKPSGKYEADANDTLWQSDYLAVSEARVRANFAKYNLLDDRVVFLKGFFSDTMPTALRAAGAAASRRRYVREHLCGVAAPLREGVPRRLHHRRRLRHDHRLRPSHPRLQTRARHQRRAAVHWPCAGQAARGFLAEGLKFLWRGAREERR